MVFYRELIVVIFVKTDSGGSLHKKETSVDLPGLAFKNHALS